MAARPRLGELLVRAKAIEPAQLEAALEAQQQDRRPLGMILVRLGYVNEVTMVRALAAQLGFPVVRLRGKKVNPEVLELVPPELAEKYRCIPLLVNEEGGYPVIYLGMEDPADADAVGELGSHIGRKVRPVLVAPSELAQALQRHYQWATIEGDPDADGNLPLDGEGEGPEVVRIQEEAARESADALLGTGGEIEPEYTGVTTDTILRALAQLLVQRGIFTREELVDRVSGLASKGRRGGG